MIKNEYVTTFTVPLSLTSVIWSISSLCPVSPSLVWSHHAVVSTFHCHPGGLCGGQLAGPAGQGLQDREQEEGHFSGGCGGERGGGT